MNNTHNKHQLNSQTDLNHLLHEVFNLTNDALVLTDSEGYILHISDAYCEVLGIEREKILNEHVSDIIENTRLPEVLESGIAEIGELQYVNGRQLIVSRIPVKKDKKIIGGVGRVLYKDIDELRKLYSKLDKVTTSMNFYKDQFKNKSKAKYNLDNIIAISPIIKDLKNIIQTISNSNSNVLILGESGTGKELFAHSIHDTSSRSSQPIISINCGSIPSGIVESELFGYEEGAFTGALKGGKIGLIEVANKGTLFLDEIGDLPLETQVKLLRMLQEKEIQRVGGTKKIPIDVRIIAATNKNLEQLVKEEKFREDLFYRLDVIRLLIPPLRDRKEDIPELVNYIIKKLNNDRNANIAEINDAALSYLVSYDWPGNIRELENILEEIFNFIGESKIIKVSNIPYKISKQIKSIKTESLTDIINTAEKEALINTLIKQNGNKTLTAKALNISRTTLYEKLQKHNVEY